MRVLWSLVGWRVVRIGLGVVGAGARFASGGVEDTDLRGTTIPDLNAVRSPCIWISWTLKIGDSRGEDLGHGVGSRLHARVVSRRLLETATFLDPSFKAAAPNLPTVAI